LIKQLQEKRLVGERWSLTKIDMHLTWKLSDDIVMISSFLEIDFEIKTSAK